MELNSPEQIRTAFGEGDAIRDAGLITPENMKRYDNLSYGPHGEWNLLDIYHKKEVNEKQPTIVSIHGGGWVYGTKEVYQYYCMDLAQRNFTVVNFNYRLAPENPFPAMVEDVNALFTWIAEHALEYHIDLDNLFVVGDSAGAQLASQYMTLLTNPEYQKLYDFKVPSDRIHVKAVGLNCGNYDMRKYIEKGEDKVIFAYVGTVTEEKLEALDTIKYMTKDFPPSFIMTSYYDFLKDMAKPMYEKIRDFGIIAVYKMYGSKDNEDIAHVFHVNIRLEEATICNDEECNFFNSFIPDRNLSFDN